MRGNFNPFCGRGGGGRMICSGTVQFQNKKHYKDLSKSNTNCFSFLSCHTITHLLQFKTEKLANAILHCSQNKNLQ